MTWIPKGPTTGTRHNTNRREKRKLALTRGCGDSRQIENPAVTHSMTHPHKRLNGNLTINARNMTIPGCCRNSRSSMIKPRRWVQNMTQPTPRKGGKGGGGAVRSPAFVQRSPRIVPAPASSGFVAPNNWHATRRKAGHAGQRRSTGDTQLTIWQKQNAFLCPSFFGVILPFEEMKMSANPPQWSSHSAHTQKDRRRIRYPYPVKNLALSLKVPPNTRSGYL